MKPRLSTALCLLVPAAALPFAHAGEPIKRPNRVTVAPSLWFNPKATFSSWLAPITASPGPAGVGYADRTYDDGYVMVDSQGNVDGQTHYWGYDHDSQYSAEAGTITMNALVAHQTATVSDVTDNPMVGGEIAYTRYLFEFGRANWGLELGANFSPVSIGSSSPIGALAEVVHDAFTLDQTPPPPAPYHGTYEGAGPTISDVPTRTASTEYLTFSGQRKIKSNTAGIRFGPTVDIPMGDPFSLQLSGGLYMIYADSEFSYSETVTRANATLALRSGSVSQQDWLVGGYVRGQLLFDISKSVGIYLAAEYLFTSDIELTAQYQSASLDFGGSFIGSLGVAFTF